MNADIISDAIYDIRESTGEAMITSGMTGPEGLAIVSYNADDSIGFTVMLTNFIKDTLNASGFAPLGRLHMGRLANNCLGMTFVKGDYYWSMTLDLNKVSLGIVMSFVVPRALRALDAAFQDIELEVSL
jgi:hypothetical protein